jgi:hypothetical protein
MVNKTLNEEMLEGGANVTYCPKEFIFYLMKMGKRALKNFK